MTGSMYAAIAGLRTHMQQLNVIGHNVANVNTTAYKAGRSVFRTALYTSISGGSNGTTTTGGMNPSQIGYGANLATVGKDMSTGNYALTGKATDCMIDGDGFFLLGDKTVASTIDPTKPDSFKALTLSRTGDFEFGPDGYLVDGLGNVVYGFMCIGTSTTAGDSNGQPVINDQLVPIRLPKMQTIEADPDNDQEERKVVRYATQTGTGALVDYVPAADGTNDPEELPFVELDSISIDRKTGKISGIVKGTDDPVTVGYIAIGNVTNPNGVTAESQTYYRASDGAGDLSIALMGGAADDVWTGQATWANGVVTMSAPTKGLKIVNKSGGAWTQVSTVPADDEGYPDKSRISHAGTTTLMTGGLEMSKTDLATEISNMILAQRGYQANTRIVTVTDSMLEELVNMKRG